MVNTYREFLVAADSLMVQVHGHRMSAERITAKLNNGNGKHGHKMVEIEFNNPHLISFSLNVIKTGCERLVIDMRQVLVEDFGSKQITALIKIINAATGSGTTVRLRAVSGELEKRFAELNIDFLFQYME